MASTETLNPTAHTEPAPGWSTDNACASMTNTGGDCDRLSTCIDCNNPPLNSESAEWHTWETPLEQAGYDTLTLEVDYSIDAEDDVSNDCDTATCILEYSKDGGTNWKTFGGFPKAVTDSPQSGTASVGLDVAQDFTKIRVRARVRADAKDGCPCGLEGSWVCHAGMALSNIETNGVDDDEPGGGGGGGSTDEGACCLTGGSCAIAEGSENCSGTYQGDGTSCNPNPCPEPGRGACCCGGASSGDCVSNVTQLACETLTSLCVKEGTITGTYQGDGTTCAPNPCEQPSHLKPVTIGI